MYHQLFSDCLLKKQINLKSHSFIQRNVQFYKHATFHLRFTLDDDLWFLDTMALTNDISGDDDGEGIIVCSILEIESRREMGSRITR